MHNARYAILIDAGYLKQNFYKEKSTFPSALEIKEIASSIQQHTLLNSKELLRVYYYDAAPFQKKVVNPLDGTEKDFSASKGTRAALKCLQSLKVFPDFAVRLGMCLQNGWAIKNLRKNEASSMLVQPTDIKPDIKQKGVDLRIGLDVATMAIRGTVDTIVMVTGDTDLMPALKLARKEGLRVYMAQMGKTPLHESLITHCDQVILITL